MKRCKERLCMKKKMSRLVQLFESNVCLLHKNGVMSNRTKQLFIYFIFRFDESVQIYDLRKFLKLDYSDIHLFYENVSDVNSTFHKQNINEINKIDILCGLNVK